MDFSAHRQFSNNTQTEKKLTCSQSGEKPGGFKNCSEPKCNTVKEDLKSYKGSYLKTLPQLPTYVFFTHCFAFSLYRMGFLYPTRRG